MTDKGWKIVTERDRIRGVAESWRSRYQLKDGSWKTTFYGDPEPIYIGLRALNLDTASADDVMAVIGNDSWTSLHCLSCRAQITAAAEFDVEGDYPYHLCKECLVGATADLNEVIDVEHE